ncbi:MAG: hypothetical protein JJE21_02070 [Spirochaetaceae bacterium]|nr:hypothetical protein [Spirochaetaceae bacterium]
MTTNEALLAEVEAYTTENTKFTEKGVKASAARARKSLSEISNLCKLRRKEIMEEKTNMA